MCARRFEPVCYLLRRSLQSRCEPFVLTSSKTLSLSKHERLFANVR